MQDDFFVVCGALGFFFIIFGFIVVMRFITYRETLALAEKGLVRGQIRGDGKGALRWGITLAAVGVALCIGLWPLGFIGGGTRFPLGFGPWMLAGLLPMFFGLGLILSYVLTARDEKKDEAKPSLPPVEPPPSA